ncbi:MAG: patatin-like phospholipase family protein [Pseudomonadota bacterium]
MRRLFRLLFALLPLLSAAGAWSQQSPAVPETGRPRIGLVLSGGGARGAAHVGVLKVLDDLHIPIDAIAGTSMGAVVGGLYASGLSGREIEKLMSSVDWQDAFRDRSRRIDLSFRRKREDQDFLVQLPLGLKGGRFLLPRGLIQGQKLSLILREMTMRAAAVRDFDKLPIRFRAVTTDLETGKPVVIGSGDLATAIRASVSAPGLFTPVESEGRVLVDGGIAENLPIDVARSMDVDLLIVVDVGFPLAKRERLASVASISNQMLAILIRRDSERQRATLGPRDIVIDPALGDASSFDFTRLTRLIVLGEEAARASAARLAGLGLPPAAYENYLARRASVSAPPPTVSFVRAEKGSEAYADKIEALFGGFAGQPLDTKLLTKRINQYYGQGTLEALEYRLAPAEDSSAVSGGDEGPYGLWFRARRNSWGPNYVRFGLRLQDDFTGNSSFEAAARFVITELNRYGAELTTDLQVGNTPRVATEFYLPLSNRQRYFFAPHASFTVRNVPQIENETQVGELRVRSARFGVDFGREFGNSAELRTGLEREVGSSRVRLGDTTTPKSEFSTREYFGRYGYDTFDSAAFPRQGDAFSLEWRGALEDKFADRYSDSVRFDWRMARSYGRNTAILWASAGSMLDPEEAEPRTYFPLGGFLNLSGLTPDALSGPHYAITRFIYLRQVGRGGEGFLNVPLYTGLSLEVGNTWKSRGDIDFGSARKDASLFFGLDTFLGPAYFAVGYDDRGRSAVYLFLGRGF